MRVFFLIFVLIAFSLNTSCDRIDTKNNTKENDSDAAANEGDSDSQTETDEDIDHTATNDNETNEIPDVDWNFEEPSPDTEYLNIFFRSKPHGITNWEKEYRYVVRCEPKNNGDIKISIAESDTCKGELDNTVYTFTPTKEKFPDAVCDLSIKCSDNDDSVTQTTKLIIPNPYEFRSAPEKEKIPVKKIVWTSEKGLFFISNEVLFASDNDFSQISVVDTNIERYFSTEEFLYYVSGNNIYSINPENEPSGIISDEDISEKCSICTISRIIMVDSEKNILFVIKNDKLYETWLYQAQTGNLSVVDETDTYSGYGTSDAHIFEKNYDLFSFDYTSRTFSEICPDLIPTVDQVYAFFGNKIYYRTFDCGGGTTHAVDITTCETEEIGREDIKYDPYWEFLFIETGDYYERGFSRYSKDPVKNISNIDDENSMNFFVEDLESKDGKHAFLSFSNSYKGLDYNCFAVLNFETGEITSTLILSLNLKFSGDKAVYNSYGNKPGSTLILLDKDGETKEIESIDTWSPDFSTFSVTSSINQKDLFSLGNRLYYGHIIATDGAPGHFLYLGKHYGNPISLIDNELLVDYIDYYGNYGKNYIAFYNTESGERKSVASNDVWRSYPGTFFPGIHNYKYDFGGMVFFGVGGYYGDYSIWSTTGPDCSIDHEMHLVHSFTNEYQETFYSSKYLEDYLSTSIEYGAYFQASHFIGSKCGKAIPTGLEGRSLGFIGKDHVAYTQINGGDITSIFAQSQGITTWTHFPENFYSFVKIINNYIVAVDTASKGGAGGNIIIFKDIDSKSEPVVLELFPLDKFKEIKGIVSRDKYAIFSAIDIASDEKVIKLVTLKDEISIKTLFSTNSEDFHKLAITYDHFIYSEGDKLKSVTLNNSDPVFKTLFTAEGTYEYSGDTYSQKAVITLYNNDLPTDERRTLIVTDGLKASSLNTEGMRPSLFKGWIVKKNAIIEENENEELEEITMEASISLEFYMSETKNNL